MLKVDDMLMFAILMITLMFQPVVVVPQAESVEVENPVYTNWKNFEPGTIVRYRQVTKTPTFEERRILVYELKSRTEKEAVIEFRNYLEEAGEDTANVQSIVARRHFRLPPGVSKSDFGKPKGRTAEGQEKLTLLDREFEANWNISQVKVEAGTTETKSWSTASVPGGLLKSISETPAVSSTTTVELIELNLQNLRPESPK